MIPATNIRTVMSKLATEISSTIIRADQQGDIPPYPYGTYKEISSAEESAHQNIRIETENPTASGVDIKTYEKSEATISINFQDKNRVDRIKTLATNALQWFKSIEGQEFCNTNLIVVQLINTQIQDRTVYQQAYFENKIGFDVRFDYSGNATQTIESIDEINIGVTRDGVTQEDITIP